MSTGPFFRRLLVVIKQTAYEEYSQVRLCNVLFVSFNGCVVPLHAIHYLFMFYFHLLTSLQQTDIIHQLKLRGQAPKALRWKRLESRYHSHKECVESLLSVLKANNVAFSCVNRVELDRQHLADVDLMIAVGGDGTV